MSFYKYSGDFTSQKSSPKVSRQLLSSQSYSHTTRKNAGSHWAAADWACRVSTHTQPPPTWTQLLPSEVHCASWPENLSWVFHSRKLLMRAAESVCVHRVVPLWLYSAMQPIQKQWGVTGDTWIWAFHYVFCPDLFCLQHVKSLISGLHPVEKSFHP